MPPIAEVPSPYSGRRKDLELEHSCWSPRSQQGPVAELGGRPEGNGYRPSDDDRLVELGKARPWDQDCAEHVGVDIDRPRDA